MHQWATLDDRFLHYHEHECCFYVGFFVHFGRKWRRKQLSWALRPMSQSQTRNPDMSSSDNYSGLQLNTVFCTTLHWKHKAVSSFGLRREPKSVFSAKVILASNIQHRLFTVGVDYLCTRTGNRSDSSWHVRILHAYVAHPFHALIPSPTQPPAVFQRSLSEQGRTVQTETVAGSVKCKLLVCLESAGTPQSLTVLQFYTTCLHHIQSYPNDKDKFITEGNIKQKYCSKLH